MKSHNASSVKPQKTVGGLVPEELYWQFKATQATRHESSAKAIENAIRLYIDAVPGKDYAREEVPYGSQ